MYLCVFAFLIFFRAEFVPVVASKRPFQCVCNSSNLQQRALSIEPSTLPSPSARLNLNCWSNQTEQGRERGLNRPSAHQRTSRQGRLLCRLKRRPDGGLAIIYTRFLPCFNLAEKCLEIMRASANRPDLHDGGAVAEN